MIRSHTAIKLACICTKITIVAAFIFAACRVEAQETAPAGKWVTGPRMIDLVSPVDLDSCNVRLVFSSTTNIHGKQASRLNLSRAREMSVPNVSAATTWQFLEFDLDRDETTFLSLAGLLTTADYLRIEKLYSDVNTFPHNLTISVTLGVGVAPEVWLSSPNQSSLTPQAVKLVRVNLIRIQTQCF